MGWFWIFRFLSGCKEGIGSMNNEFMIIITCAMFIINNPVESGWEVISLMMFHSFAVPKAAKAVAFPHVWLCQMITQRLQVVADLGKLRSWKIVGLGWWFGFLGSPYERFCYVGVSLESQTTGPQTNSYPPWN